MYKNKTIGVIVPAFNEELLIRKVIETMPEIVDSIIVIDDGSIDRTPEILQEYKQLEPRLVIVTHENNLGLGQALITGYLKSKDLECDITAVMAGDAQMNPDDLKKIIDPIATGQVDYTKGNRLLRPEVFSRMPLHRLIGNSGLSLLTKFATGYWKSIDPQSGYTAISKTALSKIPIHKMIKGYGYNAHIMCMLNLQNYRLADVEIEPIYGDEKSKIKLRKYIPSISKLLITLFFQRLIRKYLIRDFHPLILFYSFSAFNSILICVPLAFRIVNKWLEIGYLPQTSLLIFFFAFTFAFFSLFMAMWMDMSDNEKLFVYIDNE